MAYNPPQDVNNKPSPNVEEEAYEPTYAEAFPPLPLVENEAPVAASTAKKAVTPPTPATASQWNTKLRLRQTAVTQVFHVPLEERRYKEMHEQQFGGAQGLQAKTCSEIMQKTGVAIEMSLAKDESLTVVVTGKTDAVMRARRMVINELQTQATVHVKVPKEHHRFLLGPKGKRLNDLELTTATKITIPRTDENSDNVRIVGSKEGTEKARHEIQLISDEQAKLALERLMVEKIYHPFISGPNNSFAKELMEQNGVRIHIPPPSVESDQIVVSGEKDGVHRVAQTIRKIHEEKKRKCQTVSVEVRKSQHKYVIGRRGENLNEILLATGVSVEIPPPDSPSETITLRGEQDKLGPALTMVYSKANSVVIVEVQAPAWLHRFIIGRKGATVQKITADLPKVHIEFTDGQDKIVIEGPPEEVEQAQKALEDITADLLSRMDYAELTVDPKYHRHIIGRAGANVTRIKNETGVSIRIPSDTDTSHVIRIEGSPEGVAEAKKELVDMVHKMENERSRDIIIEHRFHKSLIGAKGENIRDIRDKFNQVQITFPDPSRKSDVVTLRGPKNDVDKSFRYLQQLHGEMISNNYQAEVHIFKQFHKNIIGKGGVNIRKIRDETETRIDLPSEDSESDVIVITGKKSNVEQAKARIETIQKELANIKEVSIEIPHRFHNSIIGAGGRLIRAIMEECGGVIIRFPPEGSNSDKVIIRGPKDDVEKARKQLLEHANERKESGHTHEVKAKPEYHKFLIGRNGANIRKVRDNTGARIIFPSSGDKDQENITIIGKQESVDKARTQLEALIKDLDNIVEGELHVDPKFHRHFVARRGEVLRHIAEDYGGVTVSFPRSGVKSDKVTLKGAKDCVDGAKNRIMEIVSDLESQVTIECVISQKYHRTVMGSKGHKVQEITRDFEVGIKFPDRPLQNEEGKAAAGKAAEGNAEQAQPPAPAPVVNGEVDSEGSGDGKPKVQDIIKITGKKENCDAARDALLALVPITEEVNVPYEFHRFIIGQRGKDVRSMMEEFDVNISIPPPDEQSDVIKVQGAPTNLVRVRQALEDKVNQLNKDKEDRELRSYQLQLNVEPQYHPKIIGRKGAVISKIRDQFQVNIQFPDRNAENADLITITGYQDKAEAAKEAILSIVHELEDMLTEELFIDHRVHSRLIGSKGYAIRKIMDDYKVDIKFPRPDSENKDAVILTGSEENVIDCKDHLLNLEEEYLQDITDVELMKQYEHSSRRSGESDNAHRGPARGFTVREAPWSRAAPDTSSTTDFPDLSCSAAPVKHAGPIKWGPMGKR